MNITSLAGAAILSALALGAQAATVTYSDSTSIESLDFADVELAVAAFLPELGTLQQVALTLFATVTISASIENEGPEDGSYTLNLGSAIYVEGAGIPLAGVAASPSASFSFDLAAYDGVTDFDGSSAAEVPGEMIAALGQNTVTDAATLAAMIGTEPVTFYAEGLSLVEGQSAARFDPLPATSFVGETFLSLEVTYTYAEPAVSPVPLPAGLPLLALGLVGLGILRRV